MTVPRTQSAACWAAWRHCWPRIASWGMCFVVSSIFAQAGVILHAASGIKDMHFSLLPAGVYRVISVLRMTVPVCVGKGNSYNFPKLSITWPYAPA